MVGVSFRVRASLSPFPQKSMPPGESSSKSEIMPRCMKSSSTPGDCMCDWCQPGGAPIFAFGGVDIPGGGGPAGTGGGMPGGGGGACLPGGAPGGGGGGIPGGGPRLAHDDDGARPGLDPGGDPPSCPDIPDCDRSSRVVPGGGGPRGGGGPGGGGGAPVPSAATMGRGPGGSGGAARDAPGGGGPGGGGGPPAAAAAAARVFIPGGKLVITPFDATSSPPRAGDCGGVPTGTVPPTSSCAMARARSRRRRAFSVSSVAACARSPAASTAPSGPSPDIVLATSGERTPPSAVLTPAAPMGTDAARAVAAGAGRRELLLGRRRGFLRGALLSFFPGVFKSVRPDG